MQVVPPKSSENFLNRIFDGTGGDVKIDLSRAAQRMSEDFPNDSFARLPNLLYATDRVRSMVSISENRKKKNARLLLGTGYWCSWHRGEMACVEQSPDARNAVGGHVAVLKSDAPHPSSFLLGLVAPAWHFPLVHVDSILPAVVSRSSPPLPCCCRSVSSSGHVASHKPPVHYG